MTPFAQHYARTVSYLSRLYEVKLYERNGVRYPIAAFLPSAGQTEVDDLLGRAPRSDDWLTEEHCAFYNHAYLATLQNKTQGIYNGVTYAFKRLKQHPLKLEAHLGHYFDMLATCAALEHELRDSDIEETLRLPARTTLHRDIAYHRAPFEGKGRSAALGVACLTVFRHEGRYKAILARRNSRNATDPGFFHVLPAFIFQPHDPAQPAASWSVRQQIEREYLEELFGMEEGIADFSQQPALVELRAMMQAGTARIVPTGIVFNLFNLRPEICALLLIEDETWWGRITAPDSPTPLNAHAEAQNGRVTLIPIETDEALLSVLPPDVHAIMPPQGALGMWLGVDKARELLGL